MPELGGMSGKESVKGRTDKTEETREEGVNITTDRYIVS